MHFHQALFIADATLAELKEAIRDLRALTPDSVLADHADARIKAVERRNRLGLLPISESRARVVPS